MVAGPAGRLPHALSAVWERLTRALPRRTVRALELPQHQSGSAPAPPTLSARLLRAAVPGRPPAD